MLPAGPIQHYNVDNEWWLMRVLEVVILAWQMYPPMPVPTFLVRSAFPQREVVNPAAYYAGPHYVEIW
jgi:hypothetical protein